MPQAQAVIDEIQEEAKSYNRIYIASIHADLTEEDIKRFFNTIVLLFKHDTYVCILSAYNKIH